MCVVQVPVFILDHCEIWLMNINVSSIGNHFFCRREADKKCRPFRSFTRFFVSVDLPFWAPAGTINKEEEKKTTGTTLHVHILERGKYYEESTWRLAPLESILGVIRDAGWLFRVLPLPMWTWNVDQRNQHIWLYLQSETRVIWRFHWFVIEFYCWNGFGFHGNPSKNNTFPPQLE